VTRNYTEAAKWCTKAAEQGEATAQAFLGIMYERGQGVRQDYMLAYIWLNLATVHGFEDAKSSRDLLSSKMTPEQIAEAQRLAREWKPTK
jgi:TPR repeat protein